MKNKAFATVYTDDSGRHQVMLPNKVKMPHLTKTIVIDQVGTDEIHTVTMTFACNIAKDMDAALEIYNENECIK